MSARRAAAALAGALLAGALALAQGGGDPGRYESQYGPPVDVELDDILQDPQHYDTRAIRTNGQLEMSTQNMRDYVLRGRMGGRARIVPVPEIALTFEEQARRWLSRPVQLTGIVRLASVEAVAQNLGGESLVIIQFWGYDGPADDDKKELKAPSLSLESLVANAGRHDGQVVRVVGKFRGHNLYGDLPTGSRRRSADWVIKDDLFAAWVTGKKPKGEGWELDPDLKRDTGRWIEVVGRVESRRGVVYLAASRVALGQPPTASADAQPPAPPPPRPLVPPVVVFALPLDGDREVAPDTTRFHVQFNKDMDIESFAGRVRLRYVGGDGAGERPLDSIHLDYDEGRRTLIVDPGDTLREGRELELLLLPGIKDTDGLELAPVRPGADGDAVAVLRWTISG